MSKIQIISKLNGYKIKGNFKNKDVDIKLDSKFFGGYSLKGKDISLKVNNNGILSNDLKVSGQYNADPDLIPILIDTVCTLSDEEMMLTAIAVDSAL